MDSHIEHDTEQLECIGEGSFGTVYAYPGESVVYKTVRESGHEQALYDEYIVYVLYPRTPVWHC
jgi:hypothetical protein